jgi:ParB family transcriptional regulator, chromosome partitioning protein
MQMTRSIAQGVLKDIPVASIDRNPENPRLYFRQEELDSLTDSIRRRGVQVPISVYKDGRRYIILDGERRWRASVKLNKSTIPAIVQSKPDRLSNLLMMFNIHALREQWDLLTIALKLPDIIDLAREKNGKDPTEAQLAEETGLSRGTIRRCRLLMRLPEHHVDTIKLELKKPKRQQALSEDFFIEMERALAVVRRQMPDLIDSDERLEATREEIIKKYRKGVVKNLVELRELPKIARAAAVGADVEKATNELKRFLSEDAYTVKQAFEKSVADFYLGRTVSTRVEGLIEELEELPRDAVDESLVERLRKLGDLISDLIRGRA